MRWPWQTKVDVLLTLLDQAIDVSEEARRETEEVIRESTSRWKWPRETK